VRPDVTGVLYRALRDDVAFTWVAIAETGGYAVAHADGRPDGREGCTLIERFDEEALAAWEARRATLAAQRGYLGTRLYRGESGLVAVMRWSSPLMYARALRGAEGEPPSYAALYLVA
jgi:hypothetical protein